MPNIIFKLIFLLGLVAEEVIRFPHRMRNKQARRNKQIAASSVDALQFTVDMLAFAGMEIIPLVYIFSPWLDFADYPVSALGGLAAGLLSIGLFGAALWLLWRSHVDLGANWSPTVEITRGQLLVTGGVYGIVRHPIYAAIGLMGVAQALLLHNWIAGFTGILAFLLVCLVRVPREERMMLQHFGDEYREYMRRVGGVVPRLK
jgi:protein-S-isoprenylcysteine O-methyltransferase Ste14